MSEKFNLGDKIILKPWDEVKKDSLFVDVDAVFNGYTAFGIRQSTYEDLSKKPRTIKDINADGKILCYVVKSDDGFTWYIPESFIQKAI